MSYKTRTLLTVISLALIVSFFANRSNTIVAPALAASNECDSNRTIQVSGSAVVKVVPDLVTIQLGVTSNDITPQGVYDKNAAAIKKVTAAIRSLGVADKDLSTDYYLIQPVYETYDSLTIKGYRINNTIVVNLKDVSKVSQVLAAALSAAIFCPTSTMSRSCATMISPSRSRWARSQPHSVSSTASAISSLVGIIIGYPFPQ